MEGVRSRLKYSPRDLGKFCVLSIHRVPDGTENLRRRERTELPLEGEKKARTVITYYENGVDVVTQGTFGAF